jgi:hypothetical protein
MDESHMFVKGFSNRIYQIIDATAVFTQDAPGRSQKAAEPYAK